MLLALLWRSDSIRSISCSVFEVFMAHDVPVLGVYGVKTCSLSPLLRIKFICTAFTFCSITVVMCSLSG